MSQRVLTLEYANEKLMIIDQTLLPNKEKYIEIKTKEELWDAIHKLKVRGAPAIGVSVAYGIYVVTRDISDDIFIEEFKKIKAYLETARPTAVNLFWALERMDSVFEKNKNKSIAEIKKLLLKEAINIDMEDKNACQKMGEYGLELLKPNMGILTHCNAGSLATAGIGTCLAPIYLGEEQGYNFKMYSDETRPLLQGARLTTFELNKAGIDVTLLCDNMAATVMSKGKIDAVVVGCDRMAANGDGANKIGTLGVAILAKAFNIPFYMFVPTSTIDLNTKNGDEIRIEERNKNEISEMWYEKPMAPSGVKAFNPAFDVTKAEYITAIVTEKGIIRPPFSENIRRILNGAN